MSKQRTILCSLLTGEEEWDNRICQAFDLGIRHGQAADRVSIVKSTRIDTMTKILVTLMRTQNMDLDQAMRALELSKADREIFQHILDLRPQKGTKHR